MVWCAVCPFVPYYYYYKLANNERNSILTVIVDIVHKVLHTCWGAWAIKTGVARAERINADKYPLLLTKFTPPLTALEVDTKGIVSSKEFVKYHISVNLEGDELYVCKCI